MAGFITKVMSTRLKDLIRIVKVLRFGKSDVQEVDESLPFGIDGAPIDGVEAVYMETASMGDPVIIGYIPAECKAQPGELRLYSKDQQGNDRFNILLKTDGTCEIGGNSDNLVRYAPLNQILSSYFSELHAKIAAGVSSAGGAFSPPQVPNLSEAKINELKTR